MTIMMTQSAFGEDAGGTGGQVDRARLMLDLARQVTASLDLQDVLDSSFVALRQLCDFGGGAIQLVEGDHLVAAATDPPMAPEAATVRIPVGAGVSGRIAATGEPIYIADITTDERVHPDGRANGVSTGVHSYFGAPLIMGGVPIGVVQVDAPQVDAFDDETRALVLAFVPTIASAVQNARLFDQEREALRRLEEVQRLKDGFVSIVSHELRTPMATALGFAETLARHAEQLSQDEVVDLAARVLSSGQRLQRLLEDLMFAAGIEQGFDVLPVPTDVAAVGREAVAEGAARSLSLVLDAPDEPLWAEVDPERLDQVITNLVDNAGKFSPEDEPVVLRVRPDGGDVRLEVEDRGAGIPPELRDDVFRLFFQAQPFSTRTVGGLGIGLYVVKRLCDAMGVTVDVQERTGGGTRFVLTLPGMGQA